MEVDIDYVMKNGDPRLNSYPLMHSPHKTIAATALYLLFVKIIGPKWMQNRKPFEVRYLMILYNFTLVIGSLWMFFRFSLIWLTTYSWRCEPINYSNDETAVKMLFTCYVYYLSKFVEFFDTIFIILRKKYSQISFLHVFHHAIVPVTSWYGVKYAGGGYTTILPLLNTFVHIWMYSYYALSAFGPSVQKYIWWKKHLTKLQLLQFTIVMTSLAQMALFPPENCNVRNFAVWIVLGQAIIFFVLFVHFYLTSYGKKTDKNIKASSNTNGVQKTEQTNGCHQVQSSHKTK
ncbi:very long chain fatty acid elongase 7 [Parasteatoda tepidariorum]|uniref:very long chain fatty acid elongase 7 n=1 Tax=Parasteatoda tepidariorum TaxID=114398 RepID=UPI001C71B689|nr:elongation of very long chain fatty acids protein-like [Parasteatoda tepidariorum]